MEGDKPRRLPRAYARAVVWLRWPIVLAWVGAAVAGTVFLPGIGAGNASSPAELVPTHAEGIATQIRSAQLFGFPLLTETAAVQRNPNGLPVDAQKRLVSRAYDLRKHPDPQLKGLALVLPVINSGKVLRFSRETGTTAVSYLYFQPSTSLGDQDLVARQFGAKYLSGPGDSYVGTTGAIPARLQQEDAIIKALPIVTIGTIAAVAVLLALAMRSLGAPLLTLATAGLAFLVAERAVTKVGEWMGIFVPEELSPIILALLLGVVTDYSIFFLHDMRVRVCRGQERLDAARDSTAQMAPIVLTAGLIVTAGTATLLAGTLGFFRALGPGLAVTAAVGALISLTLIPAAMAILGPWLFRRAHRRSRAERADEAFAEERSEEASRGRVANLARSRVVAATVAVLTIAVLAAAALPLRDLRLGMSLTGGLPSHSQAARAAIAASHGFASGIISPSEVLVEQPHIAATPDRLAKLEGAIDRVDGVAGVLGPREEASLGPRGVTIAPNGNAARILVVFEHDPFTYKAIDDVRRLKRALPGLLHGAGLDGSHVTVGGETQLASETVQASLSSLLRLAVAALAVNLLFLIIFLRALVAPVLLLAASALALAGSLGLTSLISRHVLGYGEMTYFVPFAAAVLLLSLGSDYNIFVVGQIWHAARRQPIGEAVIEAAPKASAAITVAGLVMAVSFGLLAVVPLVAFRQFALAMALGVLLDAFLVRSVLAPALIVAFGESSGWPGSTLTRWRDDLRARRARGHLALPDDGRGTSA